MKKKGAVKYRKSIVESMQEKYVKKYGFEDSYRRFELSIKNMEKEGDKAEEMAVEYLKKLNLLSKNYQLNRVIALDTIKIEADIIDYDNKIIYETKSRKTGELAKRAIKQKWDIFQYDKNHSNYQDYKFYGIIVANYHRGPSVKGIAKFENTIFNPKRLELSFENHHAKVNYFKSVKRSRGYDELGNRSRKKPRR